MTLAFSTSRKWLPDQMCLCARLVPGAPDNSLGIVVMDLGDVGVIEPWPHCESEGKCLGLWGG